MVAAIFIYIIEESDCSFFYLKSKKDTLYEAATPKGKVQSDCYVKRTEKQK